MPLNIFEITRTTFLIKFGFLYSLVPVAAAVFSGTFAEGFVNNKLFAAFPKLNILLMPPLISDGAVLKTKGVNFSVQSEKNAEILYINFIIAIKIKCNVTWLDFFNWQLNR